MTVRLWEVLAMLTRATDLGMGQPLGHGLGEAVLANRLARHLGLSDAERRQVFWLSLVHHVGCTADLHIAAAIFGDEARARSWTNRVDTAVPAEVFRALWQHIALGKPLPVRIATILRTVARLPRLMATARSTCEAGELLAMQLGASDDVVQMMSLVFERFDGKGAPHGVRGAALPLTVRVVHVARVMELFAKDGTEVVRDILSRRAGKALDPDLVAKTLPSIQTLLTAPADGSAWAELQREAPTEPPLSGAALDAALEAVADFADLVSPIFAGHARQVSALTARALTSLGFGADDVACGRRAGLLHDVGRVGISVRLWNKPAPLDDGEREQARLHAYQTSRVLHGIEGLRSIAAVTAASHEREDGSGYPAARPPTDVLGRVLAAADVYTALVSQRAHRQAYHVADAATLLRQEAANGALDRSAVEAVLTAAGQRAERMAWPAKLTDREVEVLCLVARGATNKEIASVLGLSPKTVSNHLQNLFPKIRVTTRAGASLYASQHGLLAFFPTRPPVPDA